MIDREELTIVQGTLLKAKRRREEALKQAEINRRLDQAAGRKRPTFIYDGFRRAWHVVFG